MGSFEEAMNFFFEASNRKYREFDRFIIERNDCYPEQTQYFSLGSTEKNSIRLIFSKINGLIISLP